MPLKNETESKTKRDAYIKKQQTQNIQNVHSDTQRSIHIHI